jgi:hypothetical protein
VPVLYRPSSSTGRSPSSRHAIAPTGLSHAPSAPRAGLRSRWYRPRHEPWT